MANVGIYICLVPPRKARTAKLVRFNDVELFVYPRVKIHPTHVTMVTSNIVGLGLLFRGGLSDLARVLAAIGRHLLRFVFLLQVEDEIWV